MFEKEAEEWAKETMDCVKTENCLNQDCNYFSDEERCIAKSAFEDGAEFGYNKANEWHFVKNEDLPKENKKYLVLTSNGEPKVDSWLNITWVYSYDVIAWKEIVLPKESK